MKPFKDFSFEFTHRYYWLASATDTWTTAKLRDATGNSGDRLGHQIDIRTRYNLFSGKLKLEGGIAHLYSGSYILNVPESNANPSHTYVYMQTSYHF